MTCGVFLCNHVAFVRLIAIKFFNRTINRD